VTGIVYVDTSALMKQYVGEAGSSQTIAFLREADYLGSSILVKVELVAAIAKVLRMNLFDPESANAMVSQFNEDSINLQIISVDHAVVRRAANLAWELQLRGYDAIHLASALVWREDLGEEIILATFDRQLWDAAHKVNLAVWPPDL
jgi:predicted nucleic acid-binding protein